MTTQQTENKAASCRVTGRDKLGIERITDMKFRKGDRVRYNESGLRKLMGYVYLLLLRDKHPSLAATIAHVSLCIDVGTVEDIDEVADSMTIRWDLHQLKKNCRFKWFRKAESGETIASWVYQGSPADERLFVLEGLGQDVTPPDYNADAPHAD